MNDFCWFYDVKLIVTAMKAIWHWPKVPRPSPWVLLASLHALLSLCLSRQWADLSFPFCNHGKRSILRTVLKMGPNNGKKFFVCPLGKGTQCRFFQWATPGPEWALLQVLTFLLLQNIWQLISPSHACSVPWSLSESP